MKTKIVKKLTDKGYPTHNKHYQTAHEEADKAEKARFPKGYLRLQRKEHALKKNELMGKNTKKGKIEVERKFKKDAKEIAFHERAEHNNIKRLSKKK